MTKFILGLACGVGLTLLTPWAHQNILSEPMKKVEVVPSPAPGAAPERDWMFDKSRGTLNQPAQKSGGR